MAEDRFANVYTSDITMSAANVITFQQLNFGLNLRDKIAIVIDQMYFYIREGAVSEMTTTADAIAMAVTMGDAVTNIFGVGLGDRRIIYAHELRRLDLGTAGSGLLYQMPLKAEMMPPVLVLPTRLFFAVNSVGLASAARVIMRMHYRTVNITQQDQLIEVLETFQLSN